MAAPHEDQLEPERAARAALAHYPEISASVELAPIAGGLINLTFAVGEAWILQRVNPIFPPAIHGNIEAVTRRLAEGGLVTPRLVPAQGGGLCVDLGERGVWRVTTRVPGHTYEAVRDPALARTAGRLVGRWHRAVDGLAHDFVGMRVGVHDTEQHLRRLELALESHRGHAAYDEVAALGGELLAAARQLPPLPALAPRICHGDLKFNNVVFDGGEAIALIDLDTVGPMPLAHELGDAWRSWCNPGGEEAREASFDLEVFAGSIAGYREGRGGAPPIAEQPALLHGVEWISLELAVRFAADALLESYFGWDPTRHPSASAHHLARARSQWRFHRATVACRDDRLAILRGG